PRSGDRRARLEPLRLHRAGRAAVPTPAGTRRVDRHDELHTRGDARLAPRGGDCPERACRAWRDGPPALAVGLERSAPPRYPGARAPGGRPRLRDRYGAAPTRAGGGTLRGLAAGGSVVRGRAHGLRFARGDRGGGPRPGAPAPGGGVGSVRPTAGPKSGPLRVPLPARLPYQITERERSLTLRLYGGASDINWMQYGEGGGGGGAGGAAGTDPLVT